MKQLDAAEVKRLRYEEGMTLREIAGELDASVDGVRDMIVRSVNLQIRVEEGDHGTIVVLGAWCQTCGEESMPSEKGVCGFCGSQIVDLDLLNAKELRARLTPASSDGSTIEPRTPAPVAAAPVVPIREIVTPKPTLRISEGFTLPVDVAGEATAILAKRGAGKTNTARVLVEEYVRCGVQVAVLDPIGVWWGARSSADGQKDGLPLVILGGEHGDVALEPWAGCAIADVLVDSGLSTILDLSDFSKDDQRTFVADFAEQLYARKVRQPSLIHVVLEEADEFAPQRARAGGDSLEGSRMRGAVEQLARRGRSRGIGLTMVTQRSSALSKDVLTQADLLIAMRTTGPTDVNAIREWVRRNADAGGDVVRSLPSLSTGEGWVWNPEREILARVHIRLAWTYDSSSTPKFGEERTAPARKAPVELPLQFLELTPPEPDVDEDYRLQDDEGRWGCKIPGCEGRSESRSGPLAFLCPDHGGRKTSQTRKSQRRKPEEKELEEEEQEPPASAGEQPGRTKGYRRLSSGSFQVRVHPFPSETFNTEPEAAARAAELRRDRRDLRRQQRTEARAPIVVDGEQIFGLTGFFARDAQRVRDEAERLRQQADALDRMAASLDELAELQASA